MLKVLMTAAHIEYLKAGLAVAENALPGHDLPEGWWSLVEKIKEQIAELERELT